MYKRALKINRLIPTTKALESGVPVRKDLRSNINFFRKGAECSVVQFAPAGEIEDFFVLRVGRLALDAKHHWILGCKPKN